jgi:uncharacterized protein YeaO (DUF488 family)
VINEPCIGAKLVRARPVTIVYAARDQEHNSPVVSADLLRSS